MDTNPKEVQKTWTTASTVGCDISRSVTVVTTIGGGAHSHLILCMRCFVYEIFIRAGRQTRSGFFFSHLFSSEWEGRTTFEFHNTCIVDGQQCSPLSGDQHRSKMLTLASKYAHDDNVNMLMCSIYVQDVHNCSHAHNAKSTC